MNQKDKDNTLILLITNNYILITTQYTYWFLCDLDDKFNQTSDKMYIRLNFMFCAINEL